MSAFIPSIVGLGFFHLVAAIAAGEHDDRRQRGDFRQGRGRPPRIDHAIHFHGTRSWRPDNLELQARVRADASPQVVFFFYCCASFGFWSPPQPDSPPRSSCIHLTGWFRKPGSASAVSAPSTNAVAYGWAPMADLGTALFIIPRLLKTELVGARYALLGAALWNAALVSRARQPGLRGERRHGVAGDPGRSTCSSLPAGAGRRAPLILTLLHGSRTQYVSVWYMGCALFWFLILFFVIIFRGFTTASRRRP